MIAHVDDYECAHLYATGCVHQYRYVGCICNSLHLLLVYVGPLYAAVSFRVFLSSLNRTPAYHVRVGAHIHTRSQPRIVI
jgi:hypothetical protein